MEESHTFIRASLGEEEQQISLVTQIFPHLQRQQHVQQRLFLPSVVGCPRKNFLVTGLMAILIYIKLVVGVACALN